MQPVQELRAPEAAKIFHVTSPRSPNIRVERLCDSFPDRISEGNPPTLISFKIKGDQFLRGIDDVAACVTYSL